MLTIEEELDDLRDKAAELQEIEDALTTPKGITTADWADRCADAMEALLEQAGLVPIDSTDKHDHELRKRTYDLLSVDDLLALARGQDLPVEHPFLAWVRNPVDQDETASAAHAH